MIILHEMDARYTYWTCQFRFCEDFQFLQYKGIKSLNIVFLFIIAHSVVLLNKHSKSNLANGHQMWRLDEWCEII